MEARQNTLTITGLRTEFLTPEGPLAAVDGVDLAIPRGSIVGLVGESGCGKSVTALSVLGLVPPAGRVAAGEIRFGETDLRTLGEGVLRKLRGNRIAMIFQDPMTSLNPVYPVGRRWRRSSASTGAWTAGRPRPAPWSSSSRWASRTRGPV